MTAGRKLTPQQKVLLDPGNRVEASAARLRAQIATGLKPDGTPMGDLVALDKNMALSMIEYVSYQEQKSLAQLQGLLTVDEALTIYHALGSGTGANGGWAKDTDLAMKVTITGLMGEIVSRRLGRR